MRQDGSVLERPEPGTVSSRSQVEAMMDDKQLTAVATSLALMQIQVNDLMLLLGQPHARRTNQG